MKPPHHHGAGGLTMSRGVGTKMPWANSNQKHVPQATRNRILARDHHTCQSCGEYDVPLEVDHIDNTRGFGYDEEYNLQALCVDCHKAKTQREAAAARAARRAKLHRPRRPHPGLVK